MQSCVNEYVLDREDREAVDDHMDYLDGLGYWPGVIRRKLKMAVGTRIKRIKEPISGGQSRFILFRSSRCAGGYDCDDGRF